VIVPPLEWTEVSGVISESVVAVFVTLSSASVVEPATAEYATVAVVSALRPMLEGSKSEIVPETACVDKQSLVLMDKQSLEHSRIRSLVPSVSDYGAGSGAQVGVVGTRDLCGR